MQPVSIDAHIIANPYGSYNYSLTTVFVPGILMLFMVLLSAYSIGMEMKFDTAKEWLARADGNMVVAIIGKYLIHALVFLFVIFLYLWYIFNVLHFPHLGGVWSIVRLSLLQVAASLGFSIFDFGLMPSLRMSMSISSLWFVLGISMCGSAFPVMGMAAGTARERHKNGQLIPDDDPHFNNAYRIVWGKALCYCMMGVVAAAWLSMAVPRMFSFPQMADGQPLLCMLLPYTIASIFFGMTVSCLVRYRENVMLLMVFASLPLLFLTGVSWPQPGIPRAWQGVSWLFPSTFGARAFIRINSIGANVSQILPEIRILWIQAAAYLGMACLVYRHQFLRLVLAQESE